MHCASTWASTTTGLLAANGLAVVALHNSRDSACVCEYSNSMYLHLGIVDRLKDAQAPSFQRRLLLCAPRRSRRYARAHADTRRPWPAPPARAPAAPRTPHCSGLGVGGAGPGPTHPLVTIEPSLSRTPAPLLAIRLRRRPAAISHARRAAAHVRRGRARTRPIRRGQPPHARIRGAAQTPRGPADPGRVAAARVRWRARGGLDTARTFTWRACDGGIGAPVAGAVRAAGIGAGADRAGVAVCGRGEI